MLQRQTGLPRLLVLDMWAEVSSESGTSKRWLQQELARGFQVDTLNPEGRKGYHLGLLIRSFCWNRSRWGSEYYRRLEQSCKTTGAFQGRTLRFQRAVDCLHPPDAVLQIGGLFGPLRLPGIPYLSYHDQTVRMVEEGWPAWLPDDFSRYRDEWYRLERELYRAVTRVITYSGATRESLIRDYGISGEKVTVIPTACKIDRATGEELALPRRRQLLFVSTDFYRKGGDLVLGAFAEIRRLHPDVELLIAGGRVPEEVRLDLPGVRYLGSLTHGELKGVMLKSCLLLHPARYDAFPNVLKEALACGLPVVASRSCGIPEIVQDGWSGLLLKETTQEALAAAVVGLLDHPERLCILSGNCGAASWRFGVEQIGARFREAVAGCCGESRC